jgi:small-conductance mechanosensitive channel
MAPCLRYFPMDVKKLRTLHQEEEIAKKEVDNSGHHWLIGSYIIFSLACLSCYILLRTHLLTITGNYHSLISKLLLSGVFSGIVLIIARIAEKLVGKRAHSGPAAYNVIRAIRLLTIIIICLVIISYLNSNWYAAAASLGLFSLILGFALQTPISSLIGWFYIVIRNPFKVGDRIQVGDFTGDVIEISYLDTTLWEFAGNYMSNDLPSGRLIRFPNSTVFNAEVYNYSWHKFPYIWNEIPFHVAYESDLGYIEDTMRKIAKEELGDKMESKIEDLRKLIKQTPVDELEVKEYPFVHFRTNANTWIEVLLIYLVEPKSSGALRSRLIKRILKELLTQPDKALFPKSNAR